MAEIEIWSAKGVKIVKPFDTVLDLEPTEINPITDTIPEDKE